MFELDYLSQRLTFTRSTDTTNPRLIGGYAPTFEGESVDLPLASAEPLAAELDAFLAVVRDGGRPVVDAEDGRWAVVARRRPAAGRPRAADGRARRGPACDDDHRRGRRRRPTWPAARSRCEPNPCRHAPARRCASPWRGEPGHGRGRGRRRCRQDGPAAGRPVRVARLAGHRGRHRRGGRRRRSTRAGRTSTRSPASPSWSPAAHAEGRLRATTDGAAAAREADVVVLIVPVMLDADARPDYRHMDAADRLRSRRASTPGRS